MQMDSLRESPLGQLIRLVTKNKVLLYQEERPGFVLPWQKVLEGEQSSTNENKEEAQVSSGSEHSMNNQNSRESVEPPIENNEELEKEDTGQSSDLSKRATGKRGENSLSRNTTLSRTRTREQTLPWSEDRVAVEERETIERQQSLIIMPQKTSEGVILVDWYSTDDPENPQNWQFGKKAWTTWVLWAYTFVVYCTAGIYTPSERGVMDEFNVGVPKASLGLSMYVLGYGFGPMLFSPLSEIPSIGRNLPYITTFTLFLILSIPAALTPTYPGLLVTRFLTGFFGSPCLATGGATIQDLYSFIKLPYGFSAWVAANFCAPALGPLLSGFSVGPLGWRWSLYEVLLMTAPALIMMWVAFPETSAANILLRRAKRLRKLTGNSNYKSQSELDQANMTPRQIAFDALVKPLQIMFQDPAVFFTNIYSAFIYGVFYSFFEAFPLVYMDIYGFSIGFTGVVFVNIVVACILGICIYFSYIHFYLNPDIRKNGLRAQEHRLVPAIFASMGLPIGLFIFAWTSRKDVPFIASVIGISTFCTGGFVLFQCVFIYLPLSYPKYAASLFAANDLIRSALAGGSIIFARPLYVNLGIGPGTSVLAGCAVGGVVGMWALWYFGAMLRAKSKYAQS